MAGIKLANGTAASAEMTVDTNGNAHVVTPIDPTLAGSIRMFSENDPGAVLGAADCLSPETDEDYRLRVSQDIPIDNETFNYAAQNTGKHQYRNTTMTQTWGTGGVVTNATNITTTTTGVQFNTYAEYPLFGAMSLFCEFSAAFSDPLPPTNTTVEIGLARFATTNPYAPTDGLYLQANSSGWNLVQNHNSTQTVTPLTGFTATANRVYRFILAVYERETEMWIDDDGIRLHAQVVTPTGQAQPYMSATLPFGWRHVIVGGAAGTVYNVTFKGYAVSLSGFQAAASLAELGNMSYGSYQGLSGGTMGSLANYANSANPTAAVPTNTTAALGSGLGGQFWETDTLVANTDGIISSYQVPAPTVSVQGKRLAIRGVSISSYTQLGLTGGGYVAQWSLAFGHTAVSLATAEAATTKASRRIPLGIQAVASGAVISTALATVSQRFDTPIIVNPGEFVQTVKKKVGTAPSAGIVAHVVTFDYGWV